MDGILNNQYNEIDLDPRFGEIEYLLSEYDSQTDPLDAQDNPHDMDWRFIHKQTLVLLDAIFDLRVMLWRMRAELKLNGISALFYCLHEVDEKYLHDPQTISPPVDENAPADSSQAAALSWLSTAACLHEIKTCRLFPDTVFTADELLNLRAADPESQPINFAEAVTLIGQANTFFARQNLPSLEEQLTQTTEALVRIEAQANARAENYRLDSTPLRDYLQRLSHFLRSLGQQELPSDETPDVPDAADQPVPPAAGPRALRSRQDVILLLDQALDYFRQYEPGHPAPIFIRRAQKLIGMEFAEIIEELLPDSQASLKQLAGS